MDWGGYRLWQLYCCTYKSTHLESVVLPYYQLTVTHPLIIYHSCHTPLITDCLCHAPQIVEAAKSRGESNLTERQEKVQIEIEKCHRRVEEFSEYSDLSLMQQYCKDVARWAESGRRERGGGWEVDRKGMEKGDEWEERGGGTIWHI